MIRPNPRNRHRRAATFLGFHRGASASRLTLLAVAAIVLLALACPVLAAPATAWAEGAAEPAEDNAAVDERAGFGIVDFARCQSGALRPVGETDIGYRFPLPEGASLVVAATAESVVVYVDPVAAEEVGLDVGDEASREALLDLVCDLDDEFSLGGETIAESMEERSIVFTSDPVYVEGDYSLDLHVELGGRTWCSVAPASLSAGEEPSAAAGARGLDLSDVVLWCDGGALVPSDEVALAAPPSALERLEGFLSELDWRPFWVSLKTGAVALAITFVLGLAAAWRTMGSSSRLKGVLDSVFTIPMVLPPTVCGFILLLLFGQSTPVGRWFIDHGLSLVFSWPAAVISAVVVSFPLMYRTALGAFESLDAQMLDAARTLGWSERRIFARLMLPLAWPSIAAGTVLAFARAMGEFGCTLFFAGNYAGVTQTIPIAIYFEWMGGNTDVALFWVIVVILFSFAVVLLINVYTARSQEYRVRGGSVRRRGKAGDDESRATDMVDIMGGDAIRIDRDALREIVGGRGDGQGGA